MSNQSHPGSRFFERQRGARRFRWGCFVALAMASPAFADYNYNPAAADEVVTGIRYFGSAKSENGLLLEGVSVRLEGAETTLLFVTDEQGRFRGNVPLGMVAGKVTAVCFKPGFELVRVTKIPGPRLPRPTVQVDCILRTAGAG